MFTGRRPRAFQFVCCVGKAILGQAFAARKIKIGSQGQEQLTRSSVHEQEQHAGAGSSALVALPL
jgi:hypothetical protein